MSKISILLLTRENFPNNRAFINELFCRVIPEKGHNVFWLTQAPDLSETANKFGNLYIINLGLFKHNSFLNIFYSFIQKFKLARLLVRQKLVNHIQVRNGVTDGIIALYFKLFFGIPYSYHLSSLHGFEDEELIPNHEGLDKIKFKLRAFFLPIIYIFLLKKAHLIQPISIYMKDYLISKTSLNSNNFFPIPVSSTMLRLRGNKPKTLKNNSKIVYLGSLGAERDINFVINLFKLLTESSNNITFKIIGVVEKNTDINEIVKQLKEMNVYQDTEIFLNMPYRKIDMLLSDCHIGISPIKPLKKYIVATPSRVIDYMSNGLPIVCNKEISDHYHIVHSSKSGICTKYDTMQFKNSILSLLNNKENYSQMSHRSLSWISKNRTYDELSEELINRLVSYKVYQ